jgi:RNA polymerase sigma-70 factor, ECF subfamily
VVTGRESLDALIARAQAGDVRAFEALIAAHAGQVRRFARAFSSSEPDADDLAQEALLKVFRSLRLYRRESAFSTWLYAVVRNAFLDFAKSRAVRERSREASLDEAQAEELPGGARADAHLEQEELRRRVWRALRQVSLEYRTALVLFDIEGRSYEEVAAVEEVPVGTIKSRLSRGRAQLRKLLDGADEASGTPESPRSSHSSRYGS